MDIASAFAAGNSASFDLNQTSAFRSADPNLSSSIRSVSVSSKDTDLVKIEGKFGTKSDLSYISLSGSVLRVCDIAIRTTRQRGGTMQNT
jgi:hypothetical protein